MTRSFQLIISAVAGLTIAAVGCKSSSSPGAAVRVAHLAPDIPAVDVCVEGEAVITNLAYGEAADRVFLAVGVYDIAVALVGECDSPVLDVGEVELEADQEVTIVAYRSGQEDPEPPVAVFFFDDTTSDIPSGQGRVLVGHGADEQALDRVDVVVLPTPSPTASAKQGAGGNGGSAGSGGNGGAGGNGGEDCTVLIDDFEFGTQTPPPVIELPGGGTVTLAFNLNSEDTCPPVVPESGIEVPVTPNVVSILVAVDEDTGEGVDAELWALVGRTGSPIPLIDAAPPSQ